EAALRAGDYQLILGEIHPANTSWDQAFWLWCPRPDEVARFYQRQLVPALEWAEEGGMFEVPVHFMNVAPYFVPGWTFTGSLRYEGAKAVRSAEVTVHLEGEDLVARGP